MLSCAGVEEGNVTLSCSMYSNAILCWRGLVGDIACGQATERDRVPGDHRQPDLVLRIHRSIEAAAQPALAVDAASGEQDQSFFESWFGLDAHLVLSVRRN
jgi:hypothetical protein